MSKIFIGTSGWSYESWRGVYYPAAIPPRLWFEYYCRDFTTCEVNYCFYRLPGKRTFKKWANSAPDNFVFSLKASRYITHIKRLNYVQADWRKFVERALVLGKHLGPILLQFPANFRKDEKRLARFLKLSQKRYPDLKLVFEFRHESWFEKSVYDLLSTYKACLCISDSPKYPHHEELTTNFAYFRFHGHTKLFSSNYSKPLLNKQARHIEQLLAKRLIVFVYFNNDAQGHAVKNAITLKRLVF